jgi:protein-tyrosine phosphatase
LAGEQEAVNMHPVCRHSKDQIALEGGHNFRDLGGYATTDGRHLRPGLIYRSASLADLTPSDHAKLDALGLRVICDLRGNEERRRRPIQWPATACLEVWSRNHEETAANILEFLLQPAVTAHDTRRLMIEAYRRLPYDQADSYRQVFHRIAQGNVPMVIHCSAGKDRTGVAVALLLSALGVPRNTVIADYMESGRDVQRNCAVALDNHVLKRLAVVPTEVWIPMMHAEASYIEAMFEQILADYGSIESFLETQLRAGPEVLARLRSTLLADSASGP